MKTDNSFDVALKYLGYKPRTVQEMRKYLKKKEYSDEEIEETIKKLEEYDYLNDKKYVQQMVMSNSHGGHHSRKHLKFVMRKNGVSDENLELIDEYLTDIDEIENCRYYFNRAIQNTKDEPYHSRVRKVESSLRSRGFEYSTYSSMLATIPEKSQINMKKFIQLFDKAVIRYKKKGYKSWELRQRVIVNLLRKGYDYALVREYVEKFLSD